MVVILKMSIYDLELILKDTYEIDLYEPKSIFYKNELENYSYTKWAIKELLAYVIDYISDVDPIGVIDKNIDIEWFIQAVVSFQQDMYDYMSYNNPCTKAMFLRAYDIAANTYEILFAME